MRNNNRIKVFYMLIALFVVLSIVGFGIYKYLNPVELIIQEPLSLEYSQQILEENETRIKNALSEFSRETRQKKDLEAKEIIYETHELTESKEGKIILEDDKELIFTYEVKDTKSPIIKGDLEYETELDRKVDFNLTAVDNYDSEIKLSIEGNVDYAKPGEYKLQVVAEDTSGNTSKEEIIVKVNKAAIKEELSVEKDKKENSTSESNGSSNKKPKETDQTKTNTQNKPDGKNNHNNSSGGTVSGPLFEEDGDFQGHDGVMHYFYKTYETFDACRAASESLLEENHSWHSTSCQDKSLYYTKQQ